MDTPANGKLAATPSYAERRAAGKETPLRSPRVARGDAPPNASQVLTRLFPHAGRLAIASTSSINSSCASLRTSTSVLAGGASVFT